MSNSAKSGEDARLDRRQVLKLSALGMLSLGGSLRAFAGPFQTAGQEGPVPIDKRLDPRWVQSLFERGQEPFYRKDEAATLGMPVGGLFAGCVYLGGDGRLWLWDIFNIPRFGVIGRNGAYQGQTVPPANGAEYVSPSGPITPFKHGLGLQVGDGEMRRLDSSGWSDVEFRGQYPIGDVRYRDAHCPVEARLEAYSPFVPLDIDDSSIPVVVLTVTVTNRTDKVQKVKLSAWSANPCCIESRLDAPVDLDAKLAKSSRLTKLLFCAREPQRTARPSQPDIVFEDWNKDSYNGWEVSGTAFGSRPLHRSEVIDYQGDLGGEGDRIVNSHSSAPATEVGARDACKGRLLSRPFVIDRSAIRLYVGGGSHIGQTCVNLLIDGQVVASITGRDNNRMSLRAISVSQHIGKTARIEILDDYDGPWGHIGVGSITFTDEPNVLPKLQDRTDYGTFCLAALGGQIVGDQTSLSKQVLLKPGQSKRLTFLLAWHFPNLHIDGLPAEGQGQHYATRFMDAGAVADYVSANFARLDKTTRLWRDTWYDSTLPYWFLDRTFANTSILATNTCHRLKSGRFWAWEGVGCCVGTCTHVWQYAQAMGRLFPEVERRQREEVDYGLGFDPATGAIGMRGEQQREAAVDGQAGTILRTLREHQMSSDNAFLKRVWPRVRRATEWLIERDRNGDGILDGAQDNTLDAAWFGRISWTSSLYLAALRAAEDMAHEIGDKTFSERCAKIAASGFRAVEEQLFNGEYYIQKPDLERPTALGSYQCCHIDQVFGQSFAWQVGLPRVLPEQSTIAALRSLYKYNFAPDVGPYRKAHPAGRWYAIEGDGGLIMTTNPKGVANPFGNAQDWQVGYFNECMSGFEHQAASHMIAEGLVLEGLAVTKAIHDRYDARRRNPYNEIECSDHYARAMASYGTFVTACGFECHGPRGHIGFAPKIHPEAFKAAFTAADGWGTYAQTIDKKGHLATLKVLSGQLKLKTLALDSRTEVRSVRVKLANRPVACRLGQSGSRCVLTLDEQVVLGPGRSLVVSLTSAP